MCALQYDADVGADTVLSPLFIEFILWLMRGATVHLSTEFFEGSELGLKFSIDLRRC